MSFPVGVGIVTYNRREILNDTIDRVRGFTRDAGALFVVADDGSNDGTQQMLRDKNVPCITGINMGIAWNKNRALFLLSHVLGCETVILLEDDTQPSRAGWEAEWMDAARRWGHVNYAGDWMHDHFESGAGTAADPVHSLAVTAQCSSYSREALTYGGYYDPRFKGYGHEHVEHTRRLMRIGYGGIDERIDGVERIRYFMVKGDLTVVNTQSHWNVEQEALNLQLARQLLCDQGYRAPWGPDSELRQFRSETEIAMSAGLDRFRLSPVRPVEQAAGHGMFARLFEQT